MRRWLTATGSRRSGLGGHPADTGRVKGTTRGALMVVGTMQVARAFAKQMGMADLEWRQEGEHVQRAEFTEWPHSQQLEQAIAASAAREWVTEKTTRTRWRFATCTNARRDSGRIRDLVQGPVTNTSSLRGKVRCLLGAKSLRTRHSHGGPRWH